MQFNRRQLITLFTYACIPKVFAQENSASLAIRKDKREPSFDSKLRQDKRISNVKEFGAVGDGLVDDTIALQKAIDSGGKIQFEPNAKYKTTAPLILKHGSSNIQHDDNLIDFNYSHIIPYFDDYALKIESIGNINNPTSNIAYFDLRNLYINLGASAKSKALKIGTANQMIDSFQYSTITNFLIEDTSNTHGIVTEIENARHIRFVGMVHRGCGVRVQCQDDNAFCGDMEFLTCEFAGNSNHPPLTLTAGKDEKQLATSSVRGITFDNCDIYGSSTILRAIGKGDLGDIWFDKVQFDAPPLALNRDTALDIYATDNARLFQLHFSQCYFVGYTGIVINMLLKHQSTSTQIDFSNCHFGNITNQNPENIKAIIAATNFQNFAFNNCEFTEIKATTIFNFVNTHNFKLLGNKAENCKLTKYLVSLNGQSKNYIISNNLADTFKEDLIIVEDKQSDIKSIVNNNLHIF